MSYFKIIIYTIILFVSIFGFIKCCSEYHNDYIYAWGVVFFPLLALGSLMCIGDTK